jgi:hypothetical protein
LSDVPDRELIDVFFRRMAEYGVETRCIVLLRERTKETLSLELASD